MIPDPEERLRQLDQAFARGRDRAMADRAAARAEELERIEREGYELGYRLVAELARVFLGVTIPAERRSSAPLSEDDRPGNEPLAGQLEALNEQARRELPAGPA